MGSLLLDESPLVIQPSLVRRFGVGEAAILQQLHYWLLRAQNSHDGHIWAYKTYAEWSDETGMSTKAVRGALKKLRDVGVVVSIDSPVDPHDRTLWWRIDYRKVNPEPSPNPPPPPTGHFDVPERADRRDREGSSSKAETTNRDYEGVGERAHARPKINGKPANDETWRRTLHALAEFNGQAGKRMLPTTGSGEPSEAAKRIYSRLASWPDLSDEQVTDVIRRTLSSRWWGSDPPTVGVIFGPKVFEENLSRDGAPVSAPAGVTHLRPNASAEERRMERQRQRAARIAEYDRAEPSAGHNAVLGYLPYPTTEEA